VASGWAIVGLHVEHTDWAKRKKKKRKGKGGVGWLEAFGLKQLRELGKSFYFPNFYIICKPI
jgi:hypothetical protein